MDLKIKIGNSLNPTEKIVSKDATVRTLLTEDNIAYVDGNVSLNGRVLGTAELNQTLNTLGVKDGDYITVTTKQSSGNN